MDENELNRNTVLLYSSNCVKDTSGCIPLAERFGKLKNNSTGNQSDPVYDTFMWHINRTFQDVSEPLFTTNAKGLFDAYLDGFPANWRQYHNCHACRRFIDQFGSLVTIDNEGKTASAIWDRVAVPASYRASIKAMETIIKKAKVTGVFLSSREVWGQPETGVWRHFYIKPNKDEVFASAVKTAEQAMAEKLEDFKNIIRALSEFPVPVLEQALKLLKSEALYRSEKVIGPAQWLYDLHKSRNAVVKSRRRNIVWKAIATAPDGFCHPRASVVGSLLKDIASGAYHFEEVSRRFTEKMHPLRYQRPQTAPSAGNIEQAEKIVKQLGVEKSLERRFARIDEVDALWIPAPVEEKKQEKGIFGSIKPKDATFIREMNPPLIVCTWVKLAETVLPTAKAIELLVPAHGDFIALVTAVHPDSPPILQWDTTEHRNPVSWYRYHGGSPASRWMLSASKWVPVTAICLYPGRWFDGKCSHGNEAMFILPGAVDSCNDSLALFPETLKSEFHQIRSTIEAFSKANKLIGTEEASACGICAVGSHIRSDGIEYKIDRWD